MAQDDKLSGALQENVLILLCFDKEFCKIARSIVTPNLFESAVYRDIASHATDFIDQFNEPIAEHLPDSLEHILKGSDTRKASSYQRVLDNLYLAKDEVNKEYVVDRLHHFVRMQNMKSAVVKAVESINEGNLEQAEVELQAGLQSQLNVFEMGMDLSNAKQALKFMDTIDTDGIMTGIKQLDENGVQPHPGEMLILIAPMKRGKSWGLIHFGKWAMLQRKTVLHLTLEMSEARVSQRYIQSFFSITKKESVIRTPIFDLDENGKLVDIDYEEISRPSFQDPDIRKTLADRIKKEFGKRSKLIVKQFPMKALTMSGLRAYLDALERFQKIIPDVVVLDYPDLMKMDAKNIRTETGQVYQELRGLAVERNFALVTASQGNRSSIRSKIITEDQVAEDISKIATADNVITYNQTMAERNLGLARLFVTNGRNDKDKFTVLISQAYAAGQFCLNSAMMSSDYWDLIGENKSIDNEGDEE